MILANIVTALLFPDSDSTRGPQRLKPQTLSKPPAARVELVPFPIAASAHPEDS